MKTVTLILPVYTYHIDFVGHVSNIVYIQWMEIGRMKFMEEIGMPVHKLSEQGIAPVLIETEIFYKHSLKLGDCAHMEIWLDELKSVSVNVAFRMCNGEGTLVATAHQKGVFVDLQKMRPQRLPVEMLERFEPYLQEATPSGTRVSRSRSK
ncbi:acyl-CoA thioesterase [Gloeobacter morelensis]|uniref:Acyl-CoA thioesterase n=1 Tax=Gloeobacter morelensis MG652769 TaxID=2781736 RepID=A0ABY3PMC9_9CYAN|nr:thioesterase family protein [Gloeobacter morelensis]UFP94739.1 acyl-CoA thioesterase [Gloeobacter morelensis MG652769]